MTTALVLLVVAVVLIVGVRIFQPGPPAGLGVFEGRLTACPESPNCVCTCADDRQHAIEPLPFEGESANAVARLKQAVGKLPRTRLVSETDTYLHYESVSRVFGFVDDVEFLVDAGAGVIHFRSASRVGHSDLGVNRARMETVRRHFLN